MDSQDAERAKIAADADRELTRLWRAWRTVHQMCQDRVQDSHPQFTNETFADHPQKGYQIGEEEVNISLDGFRRAYSDPSGAPESVCPPKLPEYCHICNQPS